MVNYSTTWDYWNLGANSTNATTTGATATVWIEWQNDATGTNCWPYWVLAATATAGYIPVSARRESEEERQQRHAREAEQQRLWAEEDAKRKREAAEAKERARKLLVEGLSAEQQQEYEGGRFFTVISKDGERRYRITQGRSRNVQLITADGQVARTYCAHPQEAVPDEDTMLAQKLMLEHCEDEFLRVAYAS